MFKYGILLSIYVKTWYSENRFLGQLIQSGPIGRRLDYVEMRQEDKKKCYCGFGFDMTTLISPERDYKSLIASGVHGSVEKNSKLFKKF